VRSPAVGTFACCRHLDIIRVFAKHPPMSWFLSPSLRRCIALLLLLLDLTLEPGSALSFSSVTDSDDDLVADLCTRENFSWTTAAAVDETISFTQETACGSPSAEKQPLVTYDSARAVASSDFDSVFLLVTASEIVPSGYAASRLGERLAHRNTYLAHRRSIVLII
jgi:hypothetical protein